MEKFNDPVAEDFDEDKLLTRRIQVTKCMVALLLFCEPSRQGNCEKGAKICIARQFADDIRKWVKSVKKVMLFTKFFRLDDVVTRVSSRYSEIASNWLREIVRFLLAFTKNRPRVSLLSLSGYGICRNERSPLSRTALVPW